MEKKRVLCYGDSNTWGYDAETGLRFGADIRWPAVMARQLGEGWEVVEAGLSGRTTVFDDPLHEGLSGLAHLTPIMSSASLLDAMVVMLGTNDCKQRFNVNGENIGKGLARLVEKALGLPCWNGQPRLILVAPVIIQLDCETSAMKGEMGAGCARKSRELIPFVQAWALTYGCEYLDCNECCNASPIDFMHLDASSHVALGQRMAKLLQGAPSPAEKTS